jgi:hypothetical protein
VIDIKFYWIRVFKVKRSKKFKMMFEKLANNLTPYENDINNDIERTFPDL